MRNLRNRLNLCLAKLTQVKLLLAWDSRMTFREPLLLCFSVIWRLSYLCWNVNNKKKRCGLFFFFLWSVEKLTFCKTTSRIKKNSQWKQKNIKGLPDFIRVHWPGEMRGKECKRQCNCFLGKYKGGNTVISEFLSFSSRWLKELRTLKENWEMVKCLSGSSATSYEEVLQSLLFEGWSLVLTEAVGGEL